MSRLSFVIAALMLGGCGSNPCAGRGPRCVNALVEGYAGPLDQLRISIDQPMAQTTTTPDPPSSFSLPVKLAVVLPAAAQGTVSVGIEGLSNQQVVATATPRAVTLPASETVTFVLAGANGGANDLSIPPSDLGGIASVVPSSFHFAVNRGASDTKTFHFGNGTAAAVVASASLSGDGAFTISNDGCAGAMIATDGGCDVTVQFAPTSSGSGKTTTLTVASATASISGDAAPVWVVEHPVAATYDVRAITGDAGHYYLTASASSGTAQVLTSTGDGTWTATTPPFGAAELLFAVGHASNNTYAGGTSGVWLDNGAWVSQPVPSSDGGIGVRGMYVNPDAGIAVGPAGIFQLAGTTWKMSGPGAGDGGAAFINAVASNGDHALLAVGNNSLAYSGDTSGTWTSAIALNASSGSPATTVRGAWMPRTTPPPNKAWAVGDATTSSPSGTIYLVDRGTFTATLESTAGAPAGANFNGVHGSVAGGTTRIYVVGSVPSGGVVLSSSGNGVWQQVVVPVTNVALRAVWVSDGVDVFVVGDAGTVLHYY